MRIRRLLVSLLLASCLPLEALAQAGASGPAFELTLFEAIELARASSPASEVARLTYEESLWDYQGYRASLRPELIFDANTPGIERSITNIVQDDGTERYVAQSRAFSNASLSLSQQLPFTGGQVFVSSGLSRVDLFGDIDTYQWSSTPLVIGMFQPLFAYNPLKWMRRREPLAFDVAQRVYSEDREQIAFETVQRFFSLYEAEIRLENALFNLAVNDTIYTLAEGRFEIGAIAENELLQTELEVLNAQAALTNAEIALQEARQSIRTYLGLPIDAEIEILPPHEIIRVELDPQLAAARAMRNRPEVLRHELERLQAEEDVFRARALNRFTANLSARFGLNQTSPTFDGLYTDPLSQQRVTLNLSVPVFQSGRGRAEIEGARAGLERTERLAALEREELERQVYFEALNFGQVQTQVETSARADTIASRRFDVAKNRYLIGRIDITDLFNAQQEKDRARLAYIEALRRYWSSFYTIRRLTLYDFVQDEPLTGTGPR